MRQFLHFSEKIGNFRFWHLIVNFWTGVFYLAIIYDFFTGNFLDNNGIMIAIAGIYCASLAIYSAEKEFRRWHHMHKSIHPGEFYVLLWTVFIITLVIAEIILKKEYHLPPEVSASYIAVISILALTRESKNVYLKKRR